MFNSIWRFGPVFAEFREDFSLALLMCDVRFSISTGGGSEAGSELDFQCLVAGSMIRSLFGTTVRYVNVFESHSGRDSATICKQRFGFGPSFG